jgi:hypothetical protein
LEQTGSPVGGLRQVRQLSVHSRQLASGGTNTLTLDDADVGGAGGFSSAAGAAADQIAAAAVSSHASPSLAGPSLAGPPLAMPMTLPSPDAFVEPP